MIDYKFDKETHTAKIKAGLETAKKKGKKLGRPKGDKIKGEDEVMYYMMFNVLLESNDILEDGSFEPIDIDGVSRDKIFTREEVCEIVGISKSTVQKIINKYKGK